MNKMQSKYKRLFLRYCLIVCEELTRCFLSTGGTSRTGCRRCRSQGSPCRWRSCRNLGRNGRVLHSPGFFSCCLPWRNCRDWLQIGGWWEQEVLIVVGIQRFLWSLTDQVGHRRQDGELLTVNHQVGWVEVKYRTELSSAASVISPWNWNSQAAFFNLHHQHHQHHHTTITITNTNTKEWQLLIAPSLQRRKIENSSD